MRLEVGSLAEAVTVSAVGEVVATTQTSHQAMLDVGQVENLSIRGRDPMSLLKILPGVQLLANDNETVGGSFNSPVPSLQGGGGQTVYVDGINGGDGGGGGSLSGTTVIDAIAEVNVQMSAYTAEYRLEGWIADQRDHQARRRRISRHGLLVQAPRVDELDQLLQQDQQSAEAAVSLFESWRHGRRPDSEDQRAQPRRQQAVLLLRHRRHAAEERADAEVLSDADGARARRRLLAVGPARRHAHRHPRSEYERSRSPATSFRRIAWIRAGRRS